MIKEEGEEVSRKSPRTLEYARRDKRVSIDRAMNVAIKGVMWAGWTVILILLLFFLSLRHGS